MLEAAPAGPLRGVPVVIKDEWPLPWRAQRFGAAEMLAPSAPGESGPYRALRDAGATIVGVGNMHELGASSTGNVSVYGPARNPWDTERCPGGSSSGPAAAVVGAPRRRRRRRRRDRLDPLPRRLLRPDRAEADLRPRGDGRPPHGRGLDHDRLRPALRRRRRLPPARRRPLRRAAGGRRRRRAADRDRPRQRHRRRRPGGPRCLRGGDRGLREETGGELVEIDLPDLETAALATVLIANTEGLAGLRPSAQLARPGAEPDRPWPAQVPDAAAGGRRRQGGAGAFADAPAPGRALRRGRRDRLADRPRGGAAAGGAAGRAALGNADRRPGQRARRRPRQPHRRARDQRPGRLRRRAADRPAAAGAPGAATSSCSTPPRRSSAPTDAAGSKRCRRWRSRPRRRRPNRAGDRRRGPRARLRRGGGRAGRRPRGRGGRNLRLPRSQRGRQDDDGADADDAAAADRRQRHRRRPRRRQARRGPCAARSASPSRRRRSTR